MGTIVKDFDEKHGSDSVVFGNFLLYSDGAMRDQNPMGLLAEPSEDLYKRYGMIVKYRQIKLSLAIEEFQNCRQHLLSLARSNLQRRFSAPSKEEVSVLKDLRTAARICAGQLEEAQIKMVKHKPERLKDREEAEAEAIDSCEAFIAEIQNIQI